MLNANYQFKELNQKRPHIHHFYTQQFKINMRHKAKKVKTAGFQMVQCNNRRSLRLLVSRIQVVHILMLVLPCFVLGDLMLYDYMCN